MNWRRLSIISIAVGLLAMLTSTSQAETLDDFANRVRSAFAASNQHQAVRSLFSLQGMDEEVIALYDKRTIPLLLRRPAEMVTFEELPADFRGEYVQQGYEYRPNLKPLGYLVLNGKTRVPYGKVDERYYITGMSRKQVNANPPAEITVQVNVFGFSTPPVRYSGSCEILQSNGKTVTMAIEDTGIGNNTMAMNAVRIESCQATKQSGDGPLTMRVLEADVVLFEQQVNDIGASLIFNR